MLYTKSHFRSTFYLSPSLLGTRRHRRTVFILSILFSNFRHATVRFCFKTSTPLTVTLPFPRYTVYGKTDENNFY